MKIEDQDLCHEPGCGLEMLWLPEVGFFCRSAKDHELAALRSEVEALRKRNEELWSANVDMSTAIGHLSAEFGHPCLDGNDSLAMLMVKYALDRMAETESRAQELETKLRAAEQEADELAKDFIQEQRVTFELREKLRAAETNLSALAAIANPTESDHD